MAARLMRSFRGGGIAEANLARAGESQALCVPSLPLLILLASCASIGPPSISRDRFDYVVEISQSFKRQTLLSPVKTRYVDAPVLMEIESVMNQYSIEGELGFELTPSVREKRTP